MKVTLSNKEAEEYVAQINAKYIENLNKAKEALEKAGADTDKFKKITSGVEKISSEHSKFLAQIES